jgi:hypothetical protein
MVRNDFVKELCQSPDTHEHLHSQKPESFSESKDTNYFHNSQLEINRKSIQNIMYKSKDHIYLKIVMDLHDYSYYWSVYYVVNIKNHPC